MNAKGVFVVGKSIYCQNYYFLQSASVASSVVIISNGTLIFYRIEREVFLRNLIKFD
jgi:hypothetical protein